MSGLWSDWSLIDTWIVVTAALAAMACALPGTFLLLRRESLMGDALSHATLPGIVLSFLALHAAENAGWLTPSGFHAWRHLTLFAGAAVSGILCGVLAEQLQRWGRMEPSAALGVVYTSLFALGLLLIRTAADQAHIDPGCVLYGNLEMVITDTVGRTGIPRATVVNAVVLLLNAFLLIVFYKELKLCTFDRDLARSLGIPADRMHLALIAVTGATVVAAFDSVGSILVIAMLVAPPATALLLSDRLVGVLLGSVVIAAVTALGGHLAALAVPTMVEAVSRTATNSSVSTAGMMAVVSGALFLTAWCFSPRYGLVRQWYDQAHLRQRILSEDVLGVLHRLEELRPDAPPGADRASLAATLSVVPWRLWRALARLTQRGWIANGGQGVVLTAEGRTAARDLVRSHRLWESYIAKHFIVPEQRLHQLAEAAEHFVGPQLQQALAEELQQPVHDPHGAKIPPADGRTP